MNIFITIVIVFIVFYIFLNWFAKSSSKKVYQILRKSIIWISIIVALIVAFTGRYIFSLPFLLAVLPLIKTKAGVTLLQVLRLWSFFRILKNSGRFNFNTSSYNTNTQPLSKDEAYKLTSSGAKIIIPMEIIPVEIKRSVATDAKSCLAFFSSLVITSVKMGTKAEEKTPSAKRSLKTFGMRKATLKASVTIEAPNIAAMTCSLTRPNTLLENVAMAILAMERT